MTNLNSSILNLFPSQDSSGMSGLLADYTSIKNGSYGKLLKSYYGSTKNSGSSSSADKAGNDIIDQIRREKQNPKVSKEVSQANSTLDKGLSGIKNSVADLQKASTFEDTSGGSTATEKATSALKSFVTDYNNTVSASKKSNSAATDNVASMMQTTSDNASALAEIGISVNRDGTLSLNEKNMKDVDLSKVKELFSSDNKMSYGSKILSRANSAGFYTSASSTASDSSRKTTDAATTKEASSSSGSLKSDATDLSSQALYKKTTDSSGAESYDVDKITSTAKSFVKNYNDMLSSAKNVTNSGVSSNLSNILNKTKSNSDALKEIGITASPNGTLSFDEAKFKKAGMDKVQSTFKNYGASIASSAQLVNYYTTTQASPALDYTKNGTYNAAAASSFTGTV